MNPYLKSAIRNITRNKVHSSISIFGLGIGLGCILLLLALILHETSFDRFIPDYKNVYRVNFGVSCLTQYPLAETMKEEFPDVKEFFRFRQTNNIVLRNSKNVLVEDQYFGYSDTSIFRILGIKFISGTPANSVSEVAISNKTALKYFNNPSPLGEVLSVKLNNEFVTLSVSGVYKQFPATSTLHPQFIANIGLSDMTFKQFQRTLGDYGSQDKTSLNWDNLGFFTYVVLNKNTDRQVLTSGMEKYTKLVNIERYKDSNFSLQPVSDIYLKSVLLEGNQFGRQGDINELKYYGAISFLILLIAVTNYIFLTRAVTSDRLREMGTRKVLGASRTAIREQIVLESNLVAVLSLIPAMLVLFSGISFINATMDKTLSTEVFSNPVMWLLLLLVVVFTGTLSGLLIGFSVSRIPSIMLLSGKSSQTTRSNRWNYSFLIFHFSIYIILVAGVISVSKQIRYSLTNFKGINPENVIVCNLNTDELKSKFTSICDEIEKVPGVEMTAGSSFIPPFGNFLPINLATPAGEKVGFDGLIMGEGMTELLGIEIIDGSSFGTYQPNKIEVLFNESSALKYNIKAGDTYLGFKVRGIAKDFHAHSLHRLIQPMVILQQNPARMGLLAIKTDGSNDQAVISRLKTLFSEVSPDEVFETTYLTDQISGFYVNEKNQSKIITAFSLLATVLAAMGLFGIALITISKRTKEIGIRKVNGASIAEVLFMLNSDFIRWVFISIIISIPVSIHLIDLWMKRFAYKTELSWWIFGASAASAILIAYLTTSWQSWKAATRNPVKSLRYE